MDSKGLHIPLLDLDAPELPPKGLMSFCTVVYSIFSTFKTRYSFGEPEQLSLQEMKDKIIKVNMTKRHMPRYTKQIKAAESYYDVMCAVMCDVVMEHCYGTVSVKNWLDEPKKFS